MKSIFTALLNSLLSPPNAVGKSIRDALVAGLAIGAIHSLETIDAINFGDTDALIGAVIAFVISQINRQWRPVKRESS